MVSERVGESSASNGTARDETSVGWRVIEGDCRERLRDLGAGSVRCCVTSPPYFGLRDYGHDGQLGLEATPDEFVAALVETFREVRRVLADDGTLWLNLGDSYWTAKGNPGPNSDDEKQRARRGWVRPQDGPPPTGLKRKDLIGIPWRTALALQADGWHLRCDVVWSKRNMLPDPAHDRPSRSHEYIFLLTKQPAYFYDADAVREESNPEQEAHNQRYAREYEAHTERAPDTGQPGNVNNLGIHSRPGPGGRNKRSVWEISSQPFPGAHFATFPSKLIEPCILAGSREGDTVLDPFAGAGTTALVALRHNRSFVGIELNPQYAELARQRIRDDAPLLNTTNELSEAA